VFIRWLLMLQVKGDTHLLHMLQTIKMLQVKGDTHLLHMLQTIKMLHVKGDTYLAEDSFLMSWQSEETVDWHLDGLRERLGFYKPHCRP
jgi:hypothetical protein